ncbi:hypothetical protein [Polyangium mundeleinium]|uniref:VWFC domain-containing protein n=1 Tax=Polyangium mundeleinium TaxID=2995306 RepID=A0ABT5F4W7_9BACT|nr:hypothetical protein [Polyangium mundeleinium]MDC0748664.1 hypothetical protein [Polyangium mundeleinium]
MVRLARTALVLAVSAGLAALAVPACIIGSITVGADCPIDDDGNLLIPRECCICPSPEACPAGFPKDVTVPDYCRPDCPEGIPYECCECPSPEWCPGGKIYVQVPDYCHSLDGGTDAGSDGSMSSLCTGGTCVTPGPASWKGPMSFWQGWDIEAPSCPENTPILAFEGWTAPPPPSCGTCKCDAPEGTCKLPETWSVNSAACADPGGGVKTNFDPPTNWDGTCNGDKSILGDKLCGGVPCVRSITISPPVIEELPCQAHHIGDPEPKVPKARNGGPEITLGRVCTSESALPNCIEAEGKVCVPKPPSFSSCLYREGDYACPEGWGEKTLLYGYVEDKRSCAECECSEPSGGTCSVKFRIFSDAACTIEKEAADVSTGMTAPCKDLMPGTQLSSKSAAILEYTKGACTPSGGNAEGELVLLEPVTVCCSAPVT